MAQGGRGHPTVKYLGLACTLLRGERKDIKGHHRLRSQSSECDRGHVSKEAVTHKTTRDLTTALALLVLNCCVSMVDSKSETPTEQQARSEKSVFWKTTPLPRGPCPPDVFISACRRMDISVGSRSQVIALILWSLMPEDRGI